MPPRHQPDEQGSPTGDDHQRERPVAVPAPDESPSIVGAMRGSVLAYHDPFRPAADPLRLVRRRMIVLDTNGSWSYQKYLTT